MVRCERKSPQGEIGVHPLNRRGKRADEAGESPGSDDPRPAAAGPLGPNAVHDPIHRIDGPEQHAGPDAFLGAPADGALRRHQLGGREFRGAPYRMPYGR